MKLGDVIAILFWLAIIFALAMPHIFPSTFQSQQVQEQVKEAPPLSSQAQVEEKVELRPWTKEEIMEFITLLNAYRSNSLELAEGEVINKFAEVRLQHV